MGAPAVVYALLAASAVYAGYEKKQAGKAAAAEYAQRGRQEKSAAKDRELARRRQLLASLAQSSAKFGAQGTSFEGSPSGLLLNDFKLAAEDDTTAAASNAALQSSLGLAGKNAIKLGNIGFVGGLLSGAATAAGGFGGGAGAASGAASSGGGGYGRIRN